MTPARVRTCSRLASRARNPGASSAGLPGSKTLRLTTMIVSIVWARSRAPAAASRAAAASGGPAIRRSVAALFDQINALPQLVGHVTGRIVPLGKVQPGVHPAGELPQAARRQPERPAEAGDGAERPDRRLRRTDAVGHALAQVPHAGELEPQREAVLVAFGRRGIEVVAREADVAAARQRVDRQPGEGERGIHGEAQAAVPLPAAVALHARGIAGARGLVAGGADEQRQAEPRGAPQYWPR